MLVLAWLACGNAVPSGDSGLVPGEDSGPGPADSDAPDSGEARWDWPSGAVSEGLADWQAFLDAVEAGDTAAAAKAYEGLADLVATCDAQTGADRDGEVRELLELGRESSLVDAAWTLRAGWIAWARVLLAAAPDLTDPVSALATVRELVIALSETVAEADATWNESVSGELDEALDIARQGAETGDTDALAAGSARLDGSLDAVLHRRVIGATAAFEQGEALGAWRALSGRIDEERNPWGVVLIDEELLGPREERDQALVWEQLDEGFLRRALGSLEAIASEGVEAAAAARQAWFVSSVGGEDRVGQQIEAERAAWDAAVLAVYAGSDATEALAAREDALCEHLVLLAGACSSSEELPDSGLAALSDPGWSWEDEDPAAGWEAAWATLQALEDVEAAWAAWAVIAPLASYADEVDVAAAFAALARAEAADLEGEAAIARAAIRVGAELGVLAASYALSGELAAEATELVSAPATEAEARAAWEAAAIAALSGASADFAGLEAIVSARLRWAWGSEQEPGLSWTHAEEAARRGDAEELAWAVAELGG